MTNKIRPPTHSSNQDPSLRAEAEGDMPDLVRAPDPTRGPVEAGAIDANALGGSSQFASLEALQRAFNPEAAAELRRDMNEPNGLGKPYRPNEAERLWQRYNDALAAYKADYAGTRSEKMQKPFLEAKQAMIDAGLMTGDV